MTSDQKALHLTISIPTYNDAPTIGPLVEQSLKVLAQLTPHFQVFVINDGSQDNTASIVKQLIQNHPNQIILREHQKNLGFGVTIAEVYTLPESEWIFFLPGDGQIPADQILKLYPLTKNYDFILGHRKKRNDFFIRLFNSWCYNQLISLLAGQKVNDVNSVGLLKRTVLENIKLNSKSAFIHAEIFLRALQQGTRFIEVEVEHQNRRHGCASGNKFRVILNTILDLLRYILKRGH